MSYLISHCYEYGQLIPEANPEKPPLNIGFWQDKKIPRKFAQRRNGDCKIVTVSLDKVVPRDTRWIDVMLSERP